MEPLGVRAELVRTVAAQVDDSQQKLSVVDSRLQQYSASSSDLGEYGGAADQFSRFCDAWVGEARLVQSAAYSTWEAMKLAADDYDKADASASLRVAEAAQPAGY